MRYMSATLLWLQVISALCASGCEDTSCQRTREERAADTLQELGSWVRIQRDQRLPGNPVIGVDLAGVDLQDDAAGALADLPHLRDLNLILQRLFGCPFTS